MKHPLSAVLTVFIICSVFAPEFSLRAEEGAPLTMAVLDFESSGEKLKGMGSDAAQLLAAHLSASSSVMLVERQEIEKLLGEIELGQGGVVTPESAAKVGQMLGAQTLVTGRMFQAGSSYYMVAKIMGVETGRVYGETVTFSDPDQIGTATEGLSKKIDLLITEKGSSFVASVETEEQYLERLANQIKGRKLPIMGVSVAEQHLTRPAQDPAVQTEFIRLYQKLGGMTTSDPKKAKIWVSGEAFSERGMQRGNLVACRARVEIKIQTVDKGLLMDRQTSAAIGLGEVTSGKQALEKAARVLFERNLDKMVPQ